MALLGRILSDAVWQGVGVIAALIFGLIGFYLGSKPRNRRWLYSAGAIIFFIIAFGSGAEVQRRSGEIIEEPSSPNAIKQAAIATATIVPQRAVQVADIPKTDLESGKYSGGVTTKNSGVSIHDFTASARFYTPSVKGDWSYGFYFRDDGHTTYILVITGSGVWRATMSQPNEHFTYRSGRIQNFDTTPGNYNNILLIVQGSKALLFANSQYVDTILLPLKVVDGDVTLLGGYYSGDIKGTIIQVEDFTVNTLN